MTSEVDLSFQEHLISGDDFREIWGMKLAASGDFFWYEDVITQPLNNVWTVVETGDEDDGSWYAAPGYHVVNKIGYVLTEKPWDNDTPDAIYFLDDMDHDLSEYWPNGRDEDGVEIEIGPTA